MVCVTGASGAIGAEIVRSVLAQGNHSPPPPLLPTIILCFNLPPPSPPTGARCSFCDVAPLDALVAELSAKHSISSIMTQVVNVGEEEQVAAWINATAQVSSLRCCESGRYNRCWRRHGAESTAS